ncbi:hypothetical protein C2W64_00649 [Brevibacillus laterosporus]|nr:hypothetical protein C2W64_00649 [Brevibacillus laterosporus]
MPPSKLSTVNPPHTKLSIFMVTTENRVSLEKRFCKKAGLHL